MLSVECALLGEHKQNREPCVTEFLDCETSRQLERHSVNAQAIVPNMPLGACEVKNLGNGVWE